MSTQITLEQNAPIDNELVGAEVLSILQDVNDQHRSRRTPAPVQLVKWDALDSAIPARTWWMPDWLTPAPTLIAGAGGKGKSMLMQAICTSLATGREYITRVDEPVACLTWSCEDDEQEILRRQAKLNAYFGIDQEHLARLHVAARAGCDNVLYDLNYGRAQPTALLKDLRAQVNDLRVDVLVLDNISQVFGGISADAHQVTSFVNCISGLVTGRPFAPILVGHVARTPGSQFAGSAAWENAVRMRWHLGSTKPTEDSDEGDQFDAGKLYFSRRKSNYSAIGSVELTRRDGVLVPADDKAASEAKMQRVCKVDAILLEGLREVHRRCLGPTVNKGSALYLPNMLRENGLAADASIQELGLSLHRMLSDGRLIMGRVGKYRNGTTKEGPVEPGHSL